MTSVVPATNLAASLASRQQLWGVGFSCALLALVALACSAGTSSVSDGQLDASRIEWALGADTVVRRSSDGLAQQVRLSRNPLAPGDTFVVETTLWNTSATPVRVWRGYLCRIDVVETTLALAGTVCLPATGPVTLAPGDSVRAAERLVIASPPGRYPFRVRQTVDDTLSVTVDVVVQTR